jgi:hypothetical protein
MYRLNPDEPYREYDPGITRKFEPLGDLADVADIAPELLGELVGGLATRGRSTGAKVLAEGGGAIIGNLATQGVQSAAGVQRETPEQIQSRAVVAGVAPAGATYAAKGAQHVLNPLSGRGVSVARERADIQKMAKNREWSELLIHQASHNPIARRLASQSAAGSDRIPAALRQQEDDLLEALETVQDAKSAGLIVNTLDDVVKQEADRIVSEGLPNKALSYKRGGEALQEGVKRYRKASSLRVGRLYNEARSIERPEFDLTSVSVQQGSRKGETVNLIEWAQQALEPRRVGDVEKAAPLPKSVMDELELIAAIKDPSLASQTTELGEVDMFKLFEGVRSNLWDAAHPAAGEVYTNSHRVADEAYDLLTSALYYPKNANPDFQKAWEKARFAAFERKNVLGADWIRKTLKAGDEGQSQSYTQLAKALSKPGMAEQITFLRGIVDRESWGKFQDAVRTEWLLEPEKLARKMRAYDEQTLGSLFNKGEQMWLGYAAKQFENLEKTGISKALAKQTEARAVARQLILNNDTRGIDLLKKQLPQGSAGRAALRAGLWDLVFEEAVVENAGRRTVNQAKLTTFVNRLHSSNAHTIFEPDEWALLLDGKRYAEAIHSLGLDSGTSLMAAQMVSGLRRFSPAALGTAAEVFGTGRIFTSKAGRKLLAGTGKKAGSSRPSQYFEASLHVLGQMAKDMALFNEDDTDFSVREDEDPGKQ